MVVRSKTMSACEEDQLKEHLKEQGVVDVQRVKIKKNGDLVETDTYMVTFEKNDLTRLLKLSDRHNELIEEYSQNISIVMTVFDMDMPLSTVDKTVQIA